MIFLANSEPDTVQDLLIRFRDVLFSDNGALVLAFLFISALIVARLSGSLKYLPKVTAYLLVGLACGPYALGLIDKEWLDGMQVVKEIGLALIVFLVGTELHLKSLGSVSSSSNKIAIVEMGLTGVLVGGGCLIVCLLTGLDWRLAPVLTTFAIATAPAATLAVVREFNADGPVARHIKGGIARDNVVALFAFGLSAPFVLGVAEGQDFLTEGVIPSLLWVGLPIPFGIVVGMSLAYLETVEEKPQLRMLLVLGGLMLCIGGAHLMACSTILTVLVAGFTYANSSIKKAPLVEHMRGLEIPFYVIFFILSGAKLDVRSLGALGAIGVTYIVLRTIGKVGGFWLGSRWAKMPKDEGRLLSMSMLSQSAIALAIGAVVNERLGETHPFAESVFALVLGAVLVFEIVGPILVKVAIIKSGEVSIVNAVKHKERIVSGNQALAVIAEFLGHLGVRGKKKQKMLGDLVIRNNQGVPMEAGFDKITKFIENYVYDSFPIVDKDGFYVGFISFNEIKDAGFDPVMKDLVRAADLITSSAAVDLDEDDIDAAYMKLRELPNTSLAVIKHDDEGKRILVGMITQRELLRAYMELHEGQT